MMRTRNMKIIGQDANGKNLCVCHFECDSAEDLPAYNVYQSDGYVFAMSCTAHTIDTDKKYELDSAGNWIEQSQPWQPLADYGVLSNKPQINGHTLTGNQSGADLGLQNTLTFDSTPTKDSTNPVASGGVWTDQQRQDSLEVEDRAALVEIVDAGAKNKFSYGDLVGITTNFSDQPFVLPKGNYKLIFTSSESIGTFAVRLKDAQNTSIFYITANNAAMRRTYDLAISTDAAKITFYSSVSNDFTNVMICTEAAWKISQAYQPYRPSWQEMYNMILALQ